MDFVSLKMPQRESKQKGWGGGYHHMIIFNLHHRL